MLSYVEKIASYEYEYIKKNAQAFNLDVFVKGRSPPSRG